MMRHIAPLVLATLALAACGARAAEQQVGPAARTAPATPDASDAPEAVTDPAPGSNRLAHESSPYLLLHARNPVDWYPWGEEAIARARREDKPIFLSIGYSTCYWCHVMEREVFSDPEIAATMNRWFVSVKVDREERPDLDEVYMTATQLVTGGGGWPNSLFLTPALEPFFAGTYFPPEDRPGRPGFPTVLAGIHDAWSGRRAEVDAGARSLAEAVRRALGRRAEPAAELPGAAAARRAVDALAASYDPLHGGFGPAPKFPSPGSLFLLWEAGASDGEERRMVLETLARMGRGGLFDQLGGGFHRYSTDVRWLVPHFEKMLYDNALLGELLAIAARETGDPELERLARATFDFVLAEMTLADGGFKSAIDAETEGEEGAYYVWTGAELRAELGEADFALLAPIYGFEGPPTFDGDRFVLHLTASLSEHAARLAISREELLRRIAPGLGRLRAARSRRPAPLVDDKVLTDWNGMAISAFARGGSALGEPRYLRAAERGAAFLLEHLRNEEGTLRHVWRAGEARIDAFLDDYAYLLRALVTLDETSGAPRWRRAASALADQLEQRLAAPDGGYFLAPPRAELLVQPRTVSDGAIPSGNAIAVRALLELAHRTGETRFRGRAERALRAFAPELERFPRAVPTLAAATLRAAELSTEPPRAPATEAGGVTGLDTLERQSRELVEIDASATGAGPWRRLTVRLAIRNGWHLNAHPASEDFLVATEVKGEVRNLSYPAGKSLRLGFAERPLSVYSGEIQIGGEVAAAAEEIRVTFQACDESRCLPPVTAPVALRSDAPNRGS